MNNLFVYLKKPLYCQNERPNLSSFFGLFFIYIILIVPISIIAYILTKEFHIKNNDLNLSTSVLTFITVVILAPIYEEIIFRSLLKFKKNNIILFCTIVPILIGIAAIISKIGAVIFLSLLLLIIVSLLLAFKRNKIEIFLSSKFKYFFYGTALLFGLLHGSNFTGNIYLILAFSPILGGPQIVLGLILGYIRMKNGLIYSILFHMLVNSVFILHFL